MSAEDLIKEIAPAVARRRVRRGYIWLLQKTGGFYVPLWAANPRQFVPQDKAAWQREHILAFVFTNVSRQEWRTRENEWRLREWISARIHGRVLYQSIVERFNLSPQFLIAHGFESDEIITASILNFVWREALWECKYHTEFAHLWVQQDRKRLLDAALH